MSVALDRMRPSPNMFASLIRFLFLDFEPSQFISQSLDVQGNIDDLLKHINNAYNPAFSIFGSVVSSLSKLFSAETKPQQDYVSRFAALGYDSDTLANSILAVLVSCTVELSQGMIAMAIAWK